MIYGQTSCKEIIARVYSNLEIRDTNRFSDMIEWIADALCLIGAPQQFETIIEKWSVENYRYALPCKFHKLNHIYYNGYPLKLSSSTMSNTLINPNLNSTIDEITLDALDGNPVMLEPNTTITRDRHTFSINPGYITTSFEEGDIYVSYDAIPTDSSGFPMVPDDISYKQAMFWYIASMLQLPSWFAGDPKSTYERCNQQWLKYCSQAGAKAMSPDLMQLENIKNSWVRLIPNINQADTFFTNMNDQENLSI